MTITSLPTRTVGSLGPDKENRRAVADPYKQLDADEYNVAADWIVHLANKVGIESAPAWDSLQGIVQDGDTFNRHFDFAYTAANETFFTAVGVAPGHIASTARAGLEFTLDAGKDYYTDALCFARGQSPYVRCRLWLDGNPSEFKMHFEDSTNQEGWGIVVETGGTKIRGYTMTGAVKTYTDVSTWVASTEFVLEFYLASNTLYVSKDGAAAVSCGTAPTGAMGFGMISDGLGAAGKLLRLYNLHIRADWSA